MPTKFTHDEADTIENALIEALDRLHMNNMNGEEDDAIALVKKALASFNHEPDSRSE